MVELNKKKTPAFIFCVLKFPVLCCFHRKKWKIGQKLSIEKYTACRDFSVFTIKKQGFHSNRLDTDNTTSIGHKMLEKHLFPGPMCVVSIRTKV